MSTIGSGFVIGRLAECDLHHWPGFPGDGVSGFDGAVERADAEVGMRIATSGQSAALIVSRDVPRMYTRLLTFAVAVIAASTRPR